MKIIIKICLILFVIVTFTNCEQNEILPNFEESGFYNQNLDKSDPPFLFNNLYNDFINGGGIELSLDSLDLSNIPFNHYKKAALIQLNGKYILLLQFEEDLYYANQAVCDKKYTETLDPKTHKVISVDCSGQGNQCTIEVFVNKDQTISVSIILCI